MFLKGVKAVCFDRLLQVWILNGLDFDAPTKKTAAKLPHSKHKFTHRYNT